MIIKYGTRDTNIDITELCYKNYCKNDIIYIPENDVNRAKLFGDPLYGIVKSIFIINDLGESIEYDNYTNIYINTTNNTVRIDNDIEIISKLTNIHNNLKISFGSFTDEYPEQIMSVKYLTGNEKVLEIGGNIGRNSLVIASILNKNNNTNFVSLESNRESSLQLTYNKDINNLKFHIEQSALSKRKLIQKGWNTIVSDVLEDGYENVNTITLDELYKKYNIYFDTLILDCEGAFYYILMDMPEILDTVNLIIMENDYMNINEKNFVDNVLIMNGFYVDYSRQGGWGPCFNKFFEVWKK